MLQFRRVEKGGRSGAVWGGGGAGVEQGDRNGDERGGGGGGGSGKGGGEVTQRLVRGREDLIGSILILLIKTHKRKL